MPCDLKNAPPTFMRAMHKAFGDLIRDIIEVYVDDIVVKIKLHESLLDNLTIVFDRLRSMCTKLNLDKCVFGVTAGKLLGFLVSHLGIEAKLEKIKMIEVTRPHPTSNMCRSSWDGWPCSVGSSLDWHSALSHSSNFCRSPDTLST
jgi:hypothetical protein